MNRRTFEGPMDWEYQNSHGPLDMSSPFSQFSQKSQAAPSFQSATPSRAAKTPNPFASMAPKSASTTLRVFNPPSPSKQSFPRPPSSSVFNPFVKSYPSASPFRNAAFTTPQKRTDDIFSECSGAEESPALASEASEIMDDTPEQEHIDGGVSNMMITPASAVSRKLFSHQEAARQARDMALATSPRSPGRGEVPRGKLALGSGWRDRVQKRKRQMGDRDVGSVRARYHHAYSSGEEADDTEDTEASDWTAARGDRRSTRRHGGKGGSSEKRGSANGRGMLSNVFATIHDYPNMPLILWWWIQLGINMVVVFLFVWLLWHMVRGMQGDLANAASAQRSQLLADMKACSDAYTMNKCAPRLHRPPALNAQCEEWELCMSRDASAVMKMQVSAKNVAEIINEFVGQISIKSWGLILAGLLMLLLTNNSTRSRETGGGYMHGASNNVASAQSANGGGGGSSGPMLPPSQDPNQAYIWAPIGQTPRHIRREFMMQPDTPSDTDASPEAPRPSLMAAPPQTPSYRRSPSKGERGRSPAKASGHNPSRGY